MLPPLAVGRLPAYCTKNASYYSREEEKSEGILSYCTENYGILAKNEVNDCSFGGFPVRTPTTTGWVGNSLPADEITVRREKTTTSERSNVYSKVHHIEFTTSERSNICCRAYTHYGCAVHFSGKCCRSVGNNRPDGK